MDTELERIMFTEDKDLDKTSLESIDFIISRIYLRILELSVLSIVSRAISTMYHFVLQASGYSTSSLEHFKDELKHGELYTSFLRRFHLLCVNCITKNTACFAVRAIKSC